MADKIMDILYYKYVREESPEKSLLVLRIAVLAGISV